MEEDELISEEEEEKIQ